MSRVILAGGLSRPAAEGTQDRPTRDVKPVGQRALREIGLHLQHGHRWRGRKVMRVDDLKKVLAEAWKLGVELELDPRGQKSERLEQTLHVWVRTLQRLQAKTARDFGKLARKLPTHLSQILQFAVVVAQQPGVHQDLPLPPWSVTSTLPASRSTAVRKNK